MNKNYIIALVVAALLAVGFLYFRDQRDEEKDQTRTVEAFTKLTKIGKKMPKAGLTKMGELLKAYYSDNDRYPAQLMDLYPDYVPSKAFIEELDWYYEPRDNDFFLSKTVKRGDQKYAASIDQQLIPQDGKTVLIAAVDVKQKPGDDTQSGMGTFDLSILQTAQLTMPEITEEEKKPEYIIERPEILSVTEGEIGEDIQSELSERFYVWKDKNGAIGFGNVSYPDAERLSMYQDNSWIDIKKPSPKGTNRSGPNRDKMAEKKDSESMALAYSNDYLVWRYKDGRLGVGNIQYPDSQSPMVYVDGQWMQSRAVDDIPKPPRSGIKTWKPKRTMKEGVQDYSHKYLVWKYKDGRIGVGNVQYPSTEDTAVYMDGKWMNRKPTSPPLKTLPPGAGKDMKGSGDTDPAENFGGKYLVWKYKDGRIGMGNVQYPDVDDIAFIWVNGTWQKVVKGSFPELQ